MKVTGRDMASVDGFGRGSIDSAGDEGCVRWRVIGGWPEKAGNGPGWPEDVGAVEGRPFGNQVGQVHSPGFGLGGFLASAGESGGSVRGDLDEPLVEFPVVVICDLLAVL